MKKRIIVILIMIAMLLTSCGTKTVKTKDEAQKMAEEFYKDLMVADNFTMNTYSDGVHVSNYTKDQDKMYTETLDPEYGYGYYVFMKDGVKYLITDDGTLFENEVMYDMSAETLDLTLKFNVLGFFEAEDDYPITYNATQKGDDELELVVKEENDGQEITMTSIGKKTDGKVSSIVSEIKSGETSYKTEYQFVYDQHIELPEYTVPVSYNDMPHVDSPYKTYGEIISKLGPEELLNCSLMDNELIVIDEVDGRYYQFSSVVSQDVVDSYSALDFLDEQYYKQLYDLLSNIEIEDCIDFSDALISQSELDTYASKKVQDLLNMGFEVTGYSPIEDTTIIIYLTKDLMTYKVNATAPEGFDVYGEFENEDLGDFVINSMSFENPEYAALPMR